MTYKNITYTAGAPVVTNANVNNICIGFAGYMDDPGVGEPKVLYDGRNFPGGLDGSVQFAGCYGYMSYKYWEYYDPDHYGTTADGIEKYDSNAPFQLVILPNDENTYKIFFMIMDGDGMGSSTGLEVRPVLYMNGVQIGQTSMLDDNPTKGSAFCYNLGTYRYNEVPTFNGTKGSFTLKFGCFCEYSQYPHSLPTLTTGDIPYGLTITVLPILKIPSISNVQTNPVVLVVNATGNSPTTDVHFTAESFPTSTTGYQFTVQGHCVGKNSAVAAITPGTNNKCTIPALVDSNLNGYISPGLQGDLPCYMSLTATLASPVSLSNPESITMAAYGLTSGYIGLYDTKKVYATTITLSNLYKTSIVAYRRDDNIAVSSGVIHADSHEIRYYDLPTQVETIYGTFSGTYVSRVLFRLEANNRKTFTLYCRIPGLPVDNDYYTFYAYVNGTRVTASTSTSSGTGVAEFKVGTYNFNQTLDGTSTVAGAISLAFGQFYATKSSPTRPTSVKGNTLTATMYPVLSVPKLSITQSPNPIQMGGTTGGTASVSIDENVSPPSSYGYVPQLTYQLYSLISSKSSNLTSDFDITIPAIPNSMERYTVNDSSNSSVLRRTLSFNSVKYNFARLASSLPATPSDNWEVYTPEGWTSYRLLNSTITTPITLKVNLDVNNGPRITSSSIVKNSDHPHTELLLINRQDSLKVNYTYEMDASWATMTGITILFGDQVQQNNLAAGAIMGPFTILPYTAGTAFKVYGYLNDSLGRHGPQVEIPVSDGTTTLSNLYAYVYTLPRLTLSGFRANSSLNKDEENGTYASVTYSWNTTQLRTYTSKTNIQLIKEIDSSVAGTKNITHSNNAGSGTTSFSGLSLDNSYRVTATLTDAIGMTSTYQFFIQSGKVFMDFKAGGHGLGIGMRAENENQLDIGWNTVIHGNLTVTGTFPSGLTKEEVQKMIDEAIAGIVNGNNTKF